MASSGVGVNDAGSANKVPEILKFRTTWEIDFGASTASPPIGMTSRGI